MIKNDGKYLESLTSWINKSLHVNAKIKTNDFLIDEITGKKRQVDVTIRINNGPTEILAIVETRDRSRPVGVNYIEEIHSKKQSVGADLAIVVSKNGFYKTAIQKAKFYKIRLFTFEEALKENWSITFQYLNTVKIASIDCNATMYIIDKKTNRIIAPNNEFLDKINNSSRSIPIFLDKDNKPTFSLNDLYGMILQDKNLWDELEVGKDNKKKLDVYFDFNLDDCPYYTDSLNNLQKIDRVCFAGDFWIDLKEKNPKIMQYKQNKEVLAEVLEIDIDNIGKVQLLVENPNDQNKDRKISIKLDSTSKS